MIKRGFQMLCRCLRGVNRWLGYCPLNQRLRNTPFSLNISKGFFPNLTIASGMVCFWTSVGHFVETLAEGGDTGAQHDVTLKYAGFALFGLLLLWLPKRSWISLGDHESS